MSIMWANLIPTLINLLAAVLESFFATSPSSGRSGGGGGWSEGEQKNDHRDPDKLDDDARAAAAGAARDFFGLTEEEASDREAVKRTYKKLSLRHHPDRNGNSPESIETMQKLNHHYDVLQKELDRAEGVGAGDDDEDGDGLGPERGKEEEEVDVEFDDFVPPPPNARGKKGKKARRQWNKKRREAEERRRRRQAKERAEMEEEMRREWEEVKRRRREMNAKARKVRRESQKTKRREGLDTQAGRDEANRAWEEAVRAAAEREEEAESAEEDGTAYGSDADTGSDGFGTPTPRSPTSSLHDIDDDDGNYEAPTKQSKKAPSTRPTKNQHVKNQVMECCTDDVVIALRLKAPEVAIDEMQDELKKMLLRELERCVHVQRRKPTDGDMDDVVLKYLLFCVDDDDNTVLHYAVYYESSDVIDYVAHLSRQCGAFTDVFLRENRHGHIPLDYAKGRFVQNEYARDKMKSLTEMARRELEDAQFLPSFLKATRRIWSVVRNLDPIPTANTIASYSAGTRIFGCGRIVSLLICAATASREERDVDGQSAAFLFASYATWSLLRTVCAGLLRTAWDLVPFMLMLIPFGIIFCCAEKSNNAPAAFNLVLLPPKLTLITLQIFSDLLAKLAGSIGVPSMVGKRHLEKSYFLAFFFASFLTVFYGARLVM